MSAPVKTFQAEWELERLVEVFQRLQPSRILEVGAWHGGTLWHWLGPCTTVVVIDDEMRMADTWRDWADEERATLHLVQGRSQDPAVVEEARNFGPYEFAFIDADHTYQSVLADWMNYAPLVAHGGIVAFHDILPRPGYGVSDLWSQLKASEGTKWMEICQNEVLPGNEGRCGIGVLWT